MRDQQVKHMSQTNTAKSASATRNERRAKTDVSCHSASTSFRTTPAASDQVSFPDASPSSISCPSARFSHASVGQTRPTIPCSTIPMRCPEHEQRTDAYHGDALVVSQVGSNRPVLSPDELVHLSDSKPTISARAKRYRMVGKWTSDPPTPLPSLRPTRPHPGLDPTLADPPDSAVRCGWLPPKITCQRHEQNKTSVACMPARGTEQRSPSLQHYASQRQMHKNDAGAALWTAC